MRADKRGDGVERQLEAMGQLRAQWFVCLHAANDKPRLASKRKKQAEKKQPELLFRCLLFLGGWLPSLLFRSFLHSLKVKVFAADQAL